MICRNLMGKSVRKKDKKRLHYLLDVVPGYSRKKRGRGFSYVNDEGNVITDHNLLARFKQLAIPPAWKEVWISPLDTGHLQATGIDDYGRKQYLYHPAWNEKKRREKLRRMVSFGKALPAIRARMARDIKQDTFVKKKTIALALKVMEKTLIRIGSEQYLHEYKSHGLTTLKKRQVIITGNQATFRFKGKKGVKQELVLVDRQLVKLIAELITLPGEFLFQYIGKDGSNHIVRGIDVNKYLQKCTSIDCSSKDYRTWHAGVWTFQLLTRQAVDSDKRERQANILEVLDVVSARLGNTRTVCRQHYVPDCLLSAYEDGSLFSYFPNSKRRSRKKLEKQLLEFLSIQIRKPAC